MQGTAGLQPAVEKRTGLEAVEAIHHTCQMLAGTVALRRVDITLSLDNDMSGSMPLGALWARQAKDIAREWGLDTYVRFRAGVVRLTFVK